MAQVVAKYAAKKLLSDELDKYQKKEPAGQYDPYYERIPDPKRPGKKGKKVKKQIPAYIPEHDANVLARARKWAYRLDCSLFNIGSIRFGWSSVIGIVPAIGDAADSILALMLIQKMWKVECGLPALILMRMLFNVGLDFVLGLIPIIGDLADAAMRANSKNVRLLEEHLDRKYKPQQVRDADIEEEKRTGHRRRPATVYEDFSDEEIERAGIIRDGRDNVQQPARAYSGRRDRIVDEEMGYGRSDRREDR
ncbi:hypothetical protein BU23DRAFT_402320, partial [Bimuria novae-zelandiae CBS 107.79]